MNALSNFLVGIIASLLASIIIIIYISFRRNIKIKLLLSSMFKLTSFRGVYLYFDRKQMIQDLGTVGQYISNTKNSLTYVGFWLASSIENSDLIKEVKNLALKDIIFKAYLLNPNSRMVNDFPNYFL